MAQCGEWVSAIGRGAGSKSVATFSDVFLNIAHRTCVESGLGVLSVPLDTIHALPSPRPNARVSVFQAVIRSLSSAARRTSKRLQRRIVGNERSRAWV